MMNDTEQPEPTGETPAAPAGPAPWNVRNALVSVYLARYCRFEGRAGRKEFWYAVLPTLALIIPYCIAMNNVVLFLDGPAALVVRMMMLTLLLVAVAMALVPWMALLVRRLHDMGLGGGFAFIILLPLVGRLFLLACCLFPSEGANTWGRRSDEPAEW